MTTLVSWSRVQFRAETGGSRRQFRVFGLRKLRCHFGLHCVTISRLCRYISSGADPVTELLFREDAYLKTATARVQQESNDARAALDRDASNLAGAIVSRVLGRA